MQQTLKKVRKEFEKTGLLLLSDNELPSLVSLVTGESVKGSWWGHPKGNLIYNLSGELEDQSDILAVKLINKKVTFVHQMHWDALITIGSSESEWQFKKMTTDAQHLFDLVQEKGTIETQNGNLKKTATEIGKIVNRLEEKLLIYSESIHTDSGKHARILRSWKNLAKTKKHTSKKQSYQAAIIQLESAVAILSNNGTAKLPWQ